MKITLEKIQGKDITHAQLEACSKLYNENYGLWSAKGVHPGQHVKMGADRIKRECVSDPSRTVLVLCTMEDEPVGFVFATDWDYKDGTACWITQLVVKTDHREKGIATMLLTGVKTERHTICGLVSSHPAAVRALARLGSTSIQYLDLQFIRDHAEDVLKTTTVPYLKEVKLVGTLFDKTEGHSTEIVSCADTTFYVDLKEPYAALAAIKASGIEWPLGALLEGYEFLIIVKASHVAR